MRIPMRWATAAFAVMFLVTLAGRDAHAQSACESAKVKSTGKLFGCLMNLEAKALKTGGIAPPEKITKCESKFGTTCAKGEARADCGATTLPCPRILATIGRAFKYWGHKDCVYAPFGALVAWWSLDEQYGTHAADYSLMTGFSPLPGFSLPPGNSGTHQYGAPIVGAVGLGFEGYVVAPAVTGHNPSTLSVDAWAKGLDNDIGTVIKYEDGGIGSYELVLNNGELTLLDDCGGPNEFAQTSGAAIAPDVWTHVAVVVAPPANPVFYVNGSAVSSFTSGTFDFSTCLQNGTWGFGTTLTGIDELQVYERALTPEEISDIALSIGGKCKPPCV